MTKSAKYELFCKGVWQPLDRFYHGLLPLFNDVFIKLTCFKTVHQLNQNESALLSTIMTFTTLLTFISC